MAVSLLSGLIEWERVPGQEFVLRIKRPTSKGGDTETRVHMRAASREMLLTARSILDSVIQKMEQGEQKRTEINIE